MPENDYCSCWPDYIGKTYIGDCCKLHDMLYVNGGKYWDRLAADWKLKQDVAAKGGPQLWHRVLMSTCGWLMFIGVHLGAGKIGSVLFNGGRQRFNWLK
jgi:hypothetical protein